MINDRQIRQRLEALLARPFTDHQWSLITAQGYEDAIASGARTPEEVAEELSGLMTAASSRAPGSDTQGQGPERALTWDEMERLVLGRALVTGETGGASSSLGERATRLVADRERSRRRWWIVLISSLGVLAVGLVAVLVFGGFECWVGTAQSASTTLTSESANADVDAWALPDATATSTTMRPPATIPELKLPDHTAALSGSEMVPAVTTDATGTLELTLSDDGQTMRYTLELDNIYGLTVARLRVGKPGENGKEILTLYPGPSKKGVFSGVAAEGIFGPEDFVGPLQGKTMADFTALVEDGSVYLVVGTKKHDRGEVRGQVR